ncbi:MAG: transcription termination/antitermination protein NusG, partial [Pirellulales bacterium]
DDKQQNPVSGSFASDADPPSSHLAPAAEQERATDNGMSNPGPETTDTPADVLTSPEVQSSDAPASKPEPVAEAPAEPSSGERAPVERPHVERPAVELLEPEEDAEKKWYILKVQSNREESIREGLLRRVKVAGLEDSFGDIIVPTEQVTEFKNGKKRTVKRKLYPGYIVVNMAITEETWFLVRETPGIGDFTGAAGKPSPMLPHEVEKIVVKEKAVEADAPTLSIPFKPGDRVKINEGTFENFEGEVHSVDLANGRVTVMINIFGRSTPVELESWQIESV